MCIVGAKQITSLLFVMLAKIHNPEHIDVYAAFRLSVCN
jgi:hypothetical protein